MPYIKEEFREKLDQAIENLINTIISITSDNKENEINIPSLYLWPGIINYSVTKLLLGILKEPRYFNIAMVSGVLNNINMEFYRRYAIPYEDKQIKENGDVF